MFKIFNRLKTAYCRATLRNAGARAASRLIHHSQHLGNSARSIIANWSLATDSPSYNWLMARAKPGPGPNEFTLVLQEAEQFTLRDLLDEIIYKADQDKKQRQWLKKGNLEQIRRALYQAHGNTNSVESSPK